MPLIVTSNGNNWEFKILSSRLHAIPVKKKWFHRLMSLHIPGLHLCLKLFACLTVFLRERVFSQIKRRVWKCLFLSVHIQTFFTLSSKKSCSFSRRTTFFMLYRGRWGIITSSRYGNDGIRIFCIFFEYFKRRIDSLNWLPLLCIVSIMK